MPKVWGFTFYAEWSPFDRLWGYEFYRLVGGWQFALGFGPLVLVWGSLD